MDEPLDVTGLQRLYRRFEADLARVRVDEKALYDRWTNRNSAADRRNPDGTLRYTSWIPKRLRPTLAAARHRLRAIRQTTNLDPCFPDIDCELTYLLLRATTPEVVVEISPGGGWSTTWILSALRDNGKGKLYSYDFIDDSLRTVPSDLSTGRWAFTKGDVARKLDELPREIDYLFLDSSHSSDFAKWYTSHLFPRVQPGSIVSVDDVFDREGGPTGYGEASVILGWLEEKAVRWFTASPHYAKGAYDAILATKKQLAIDEPIHPSVNNPAIFFALPS